MFNRVWLKDCAERAVATAAQTFLALVLAGSLTNVATLKAAGVAAVAAGLSVVKSMLAFVTRYGFMPFAIWRIIVGGTGLIALQMAG